MMRWDPFKEIEELQERLGRMFTPRPGERETFAPLVDVTEDEAGLHLAVYLPGVEPDRVDVIAEQETLTVRGSRPLEQKEGVAYHRVEGPYGNFVRSFSIPSVYDLSRVQARFKHGVLYLDVPRAEATKPRKVQIQVEG
ncbi:Hsp20/alpha crystallin family protein [Marinithermus hydrothermalis]|uniref:Heat shock protein Hsp20 n=1 Tax=Marinithermus hydrothermalis (strain DSM 14884 / JCM 11576 / T1) TaxID=869210 RepID=F2NLT9_MARHT|nr:Hsp20/alpha crystallin family protein [Marinithermus hydrothermalis]AEB10919.1 heat shock protein Hsp20 [Marinithermus hydrothermalis DSM 14884]